MRIVFFIPFLAYLEILSESTVRTAGSISRTPLPELSAVLTQALPSFLNKFTQRDVTSGSARSVLVIIISRGLPDKRRSKSGFCEARIQRASTVSATMSTSPIFFSI